MAPQRSHSMPLGKPKKGLSGNELLCDLPFERDDLVAADPGLGSEV